MDGIPYTLQWAAPYPTKLPLPMGDMDPIQYMVPWAQLSPQPKWHFDRFSRFCRAHDLHRPILCATIVHSVMHTYMNRPNSSLDWVLSHWAYFTVLRFLFVCIMCVIVYCRHVGL